jgi:DNA topoisomerase VI subunit A
MTEVMEVEFTDPLRPPRYIVVVEKECVWQRLLADGALDMAGGLILITGKGDWGDGR